MPACGCGGCRADREGRLDEYLQWVFSELPCLHSVTRRVRTLGHPFRGVRECANCYQVLEET